VTLPPVKVMPLRILLSMILVFAVGTALSACGKRGKLDTPSGETGYYTTEYPRQYPKQDLPPKPPANEQNPGQAPPQAPATSAPLPPTPAPEPMY